MELGDQLVATNREAQALALFENFAKQTPDYPDLIGLYTRMETLANKLHRTKEAKALADEIAKRTGHN